jgi:hypothetical protein
MPVPELVKFREKYPDYGDMDDATLAGKLAAKYPDAYGDLPGKVSATPAGPEISQGAAPWKKTASKLYTPLLEGAGVAGGAILGSGAAPVAGTVAGAGLGYAIGKRGARLLDESLGLGVAPGTAPNTLGGMTYETGKDILTGVGMEVGGQLGGKLIGAGLNKLAAAGQRGVPFSDKRNAWRAAQQFSEAQAPGTSAAAEANALRQTETDALVNRLKPTVTPTPGQASGNYKSAALEQSMSAKDPAFAERLKYSDAELNKAAVNNLTGALGKPAELPAVQPAALTGQAQVKAIEAAKAPVLSREAEMWADVPEYPMPADNLRDAGKELLGGSLLKQDKQMVKGIMDYAAKQPKTVQGLQDVERTIGGLIGESKNPNTRRLLGGLKDAIARDFEAMGTAAESGDVALHADQIVYPSKLKTELAAVEKQLAAVESKPDIPAVHAALKDAGVHPAMYKQADKTDTGAEARAIALFKKQFPEREVPVQGGGVKLYRGEVPFKEGDPTGSSKGMQTGDYWTTDRSTAEYYINKSKDGKVLERTLPADAKILDLESPEGQKVYEKLTGIKFDPYRVAERGIDQHSLVHDKPLIDVLRKEGYDAVHGIDIDGPETLILNKDKLWHGNATSQKSHDLLTKRDAIADQLANLQPAEDVAAKYAAAKKYSREEKFERFYRGAVQDVLQSGEQASGLRLPAEQVPAKFFTPTGSKDLIKAVGREQAAEQSMPHAVEQLITRTVDANTGVMNIPRAVAWVRQNSAALDNLGLTPAVERVIKGQIPRAIERELEIRELSKADVLGNPEMTAMQAAKLIKQFGPSIEKMYGAKAMQALKDYGQMMGVIGRNKHVSYAGGATTIEKGFGDQITNGAEKLAALAAVTTGHGWTFSAAKNFIKSFIAAGLEHNEKKVTAILQEGLMNPEAAKVLMKIANARPADVSANAARWLKPLLVQMQVSVKAAGEEPQNE